LPIAIYLSSEKDTYKEVGEFGVVTVLDLWVILMPLTVWLVSMLMCDCCKRCSSQRFTTQVHSYDKDDEDEDSDDDSEDDEVGSGDRHDEENPGPNRDGLGQKARNKNPATGMK